MTKRFFVIAGIMVTIVSMANAGKNIVVDLSSQVATAYEDGSVAFRGNISTGTAKRPTPTGHYRVLEKDIDHVSNSWPKPNGGAKMHYMLRVTQYGIAMHLGFVPNYPASHGCIRMQNGFAQKMYNWAEVGTPIHIKGSAPRSVVRANGRGQAISYYKPKRASVKSVISEKAKPKPTGYSKRKATALDIFSTSPKTIARLKKLQEEKWKSRPKKKRVKVNPLDALRG